MKSDEIIQGAQGGDVSQVVSDKCFRMKPFLLSCFGFQVKEAVTAEKKCLQSGKTVGDSYIGRYLCDYAIPSRRWSQEIPVGSDSKGQCVKKDCLVNKSKCFSGIKNRTTGIQKADFYVQNSKTDLGKIEGNIEGEQRQARGKICNFLKNKLLIFTNSYGVLDDIKKSLLYAVNSGALLDVWSLWRDWSGLSDESFDLIVSEVRGFLNDFHEGERSNSDAVDSIALECFNQMLPKKKKLDFFSMLKCNVLLCDNFFDDDEILHIIASGVSSIQRFLSQEFSVSHPMIMIRGESMKAGFLVPMLIVVAVSKIAIPSECDFL